MVSSPGQASPTSSPQMSPQAAPPAPNMTQVYHEVTTEEEPLAHESARWSLLDAVKGQLQDRDQFTRMLIAFPVSEDATLQSHLKQELVAKSKNVSEKEGEDYVSGMVVFVGNAAVGLFEASHTTSIMKIFQWLDAQSQAATPACSTPRLAHLSELKGTRVLNKLHVHDRKGMRCNLTMTIQQDSDFSMTAEVFKIYQNMLKLACKIKETKLDAALKEFDDETKPAHLPTVDEMTSLCHVKTSGEFFTYSEFEKAFVGPLNLVLASEESWPCEPPLNY